VFRATLLMMVLAAVVFLVGALVYSLLKRREILAKGEQILLRCVRSVRELTCCCPSDGAAAGERGTFVYHFRRRAVHSMIILGEQEGRHPLLPRLAHIPN
jgi:hypothetical protein